ncbi:Mitochondrial-processing peptidase subunit alpha [Microbotryomycetes sp. JL221]|nr:Mitochondrial-processing peptidase subunit alpha [Microbotryomycetes sp. JL221]
MRRALQTTTRALQRRTLATASTKGAAGDTVPLQVTTLGNGVRVATDPTPGHFVAAGVYVDAGSRYESNRTRGAGHMTDRLGFKSTTSRTTEQMTSEIEALGGQFQSSSSRETIMYQATTYSHSVPQVVSILADTVQNPLITSEELDAQRDAALWEISEIKNKPEMILPEILHEVAYKDNTLGNPLLCPEERLETMTTDTIKEFLHMWYKPNRIVVAAAGVEHEALVELADKHFGGMKTLPPYASTLSGSRSTSSTLSKPSLWKNLSTSAPLNARLIDYSAPLPEAESFEVLSKAPAVYTGGELYIDKPDLEFTHVYVGYEGLSIHDPDIYALATLQVLLGGGGSFSAGGPGKGMYSRLYTSVLNQYHAVDFCASFHHCYLDSGLFGINIAVHPSFLSQTPMLLATQLDSITRPVRGGINELDLRRARNQLKSGLMMALESRMVQVEDLGRQVQVHGRKVSMDEMAQFIDAVSLQDLYRVATRVLRPHKSPLLSDRKKSGKPTIVAQGQLEGLPDIATALQRRGLTGEP